MITVQTLAANDGLEHWPIDDPIVSRAKVAHQFEKKESCYQRQMQIGCTSLSSTLTQRTMMQCLIKIVIRDNPAWRSGPVLDPRVQARCCLFPSCFHVGNSCAQSGRFCAVFSAEKRWWRWFSLQGCSSQSVLKEFVCSIMLRQRTGQAGKVFSTQSVC